MPAEPDIQQSAKKPPPDGEGLPCGWSVHLSAQDPQRVYETLRLSDQDIRLDR
jgi:hypothetical protein